MRWYIRATTAVAVLAVLGAAPAFAQFKPKLPRLPGSKAEPKASTTNTKAPEYNDRVLEITNARIDALLAGYRAELAAIAESDKKHGGARAAYEEENRKYPGRLKEYDAKHQTWQNCQDTKVKPAQAAAHAQMDSANQQVTGGDQEGFEKRMQAVADRIQAAQAKGDMAEVMRLSDSLSRSVGAPSAVAAHKAVSDVQTASTACGMEPTRPEPPVPPSIPDMRLEEAGAAAAKMTTEQYAIIRERIRYIVREDCTVEVTSGLWAYSSAEIEAIKKRAGDLCKEARLLQEKGY